MRIDPTTRSSVNIPTRVSETEISYRYELLIYQLNMKLYCRLCDIIALRANHQQHFDFNRQKIT